MKKRIAALAAACAVLAGGIFLLTGRQEMQTIPAADEADRIAYLRSQGREGWLVGEQAVTVPSDWGSCPEYAALQEAQQLPLRQAAGKAGTVYTYALSGSTMRAQLLVADGILAGAMCYDPAAPEIREIFLH